MEEVKGYDISEQLDHIAYMFNVRTKGKKYENFIVNAIYTKVDNPDLMPVTQQYVRNPKDSRKYYLLDLYFPQINFGVEIDDIGVHLLANLLKIRKSSFVVVQFVPNCGVVKLTA